MFTRFDASATDSTANTGRYRFSAWALLASLAVHTVGLTSLQLSGAVATETPADLEPSHAIEASLLPAQLIEQSTLSLKQEAARNHANQAATGFVWQTLRKPVPKIDAPSKSLKPAPSKRGNELPATETNPTEPPVAADQEPVVPAAVPVPLPLPIAPVEHLVPSGVMMTQTTAPGTMTKPTYRLPNQLNARFEANTRGLAGKSILIWQKNTDPHTHTDSYDAQLSTSATVLFKTFEHRFKSSGIINQHGLAPLNVEEKRPNGSAIATTVEPSMQRVIISSKEGFLPYDPQAHDLLSLMVQLAIYAQTQPQWQHAGTAHDFTVYRPSGIKRWRFQSFGLANIAIGERLLQTVYVRRVPLGAEPDYEDQYHFWLDLNRYGFPVKMRQTDSKGNHTDIDLVDWQES